MTMGIITFLLLVFASIGFGGNVAAKSLAVTSAKSEENGRGECTFKFLSPLCKTELCFLFKEFSPHTMLPANKASYDKIVRRREGFKCREYRRYGVQGLLFEFLDDWWEANKTFDPLCFYSGDECSWSNAFDKVAENGDSGDQQIVFFSALLETDKRRLTKAIASFPVASDRLVVVGLKEESGAGDAWKLVFRPIGKYSWIMFSGTSALFVIVGLGLWATDPYFRIQVQNRVGSTSRWTSVVSILSIALGTFQGSGPSVDENDASMSEVFRWHSSYGQTEEDRRILQALSSEQRVRFKTHVVWHRFASVIFAIGLATHVYFFLVFYESALTNFLFEERRFELSPSVLEMDDAALKNLIVHDHSALTDVFEDLQKLNENKKEERPWEECVNYAECFANITEGTKKFTVVEEKVAKFILKDNSHCERIVIFSEKLFYFNSVMYFSPATLPDVRQEIDKTLKLGRLNQKQQKVEDKWLKDTCSRKQEQIPLEFMAVIMIVIGTVLGLVLLIQLVLCIRGLLRLKNSHRD